MKCKLCGKRIWLWNDYEVVNIDPDEYICIKCFNEEKQCKEVKKKMPRKFEDEEEDDDLDESEEEGEEDIEEVEEKPVAQKKQVVKEAPKKEAKPSVHVQEVEVNLSLINQKLNYIIQLLSK